MKYDHQKHHRRSIRLPGHDYSQPGAYFITIVTHQRDCLFGNIVNGEMQFSPMGRIAEEHWRLIPEHFPHVKLGAYVVMPNHVHGIIIIREIGMATNSSPSVGARHASPLSPNGVKPRSMGAIVGSYKSSVTKRIGRECNATGIWQRNYYEHIIRNDAEHNRIHLYIVSNVANWLTDDENLIKSTAPPTRHVEDIPRR